MNENIINIIIAFLNTFFFLGSLPISAIYLYLILKDKILNKVKIIKQNQNGINKLEYYRDELDNYSPLICAALLNMDIINSDAIAAMIIYLEEKNAINIDESKNITIKNKECLKEHELFFIKKMKFIFSDLLNKTKTKYNEEYTVIEYLKILVYRDMVEENLIDLQKDKSTFVNYINGKKYANLKDALPFIYILIYIFIIGKSIENQFLEKFNVALYWCVFFISIIIYIIYMKYNYKLEVLKTNKGHDYTEKLLAQKKYLKNFSIIKERKMEEKIVWNRYLVNAILFNLKGNLDNESKTFYKKIMYKYNYLKFKNKDKILDSLVILLMFFPWICFSFLGGFIFQTIIIGGFGGTFVFGKIINKSNEL